MIYEIEDIKRIRKKLGLTQHGLAKKANVSQSLIAKIESKKLDPTYTKVKKIFDVLNDLEHKAELHAKDIMSTKIIHVPPNLQIKEAIKLMKKHDISQIPVMEGHNPVGLLSETSILDALLEEKGKHVSDIMSEAPPVITLNAALPMITTMLKHYPLMIVAEKGVMKGVITKSDLLGKAYR